MGQRKKEKSGGAKSFPRDFIKIVFSAQDLIVVTVFDVVVVSWKLHKKSRFSNVLSQISQTAITVPLICLFNETANCIKVTKFDLFCVEIQADYFCRVNIFSLIFF